MPENNFEQQVQQKMDELQLRPSTAVWEEVEKRIRKEKKRRRFILWMFFAGVILLAGTSWWIVSENKRSSGNNEMVAQAGNDKKTNAQKSKIATSTVDKISGGDTSKNDFLESNKVSTNQLIGKVVVDNKKNYSSNVNPIVAVVKPAIIKKEKERTLTPYLQNEKREAVPTVPIDTDKTILPPQPTIVDSSIKANVIANTEPEISDSIAAIKKSIQVDTNKKEKISSISQIDTAIAKVEEPIANSDSSKAKNNKWEIGVIGFAGSSINSDGISIFGAQKSMEQSSQFSQSGGVTGPIAFAPYPTKGFSWQLGVYAKRKLTKRTGLSVGLNFSSYSTQQLTGPYVENLSGFRTGYYRSGSSTNYINKYYYLQLPILFHWQLNKSKKLPFVFHNGISVGVLADANALVYSSTINGFYKNNKSFNMLQLSYQTGLYTKLFNQSQKPVTFGVLFNYHVSRLQKVDSYGGNHLSSFGIQLGWVLKK